MALAPTDPPLAQHLDGVPATWAWRLRARSYLIVLGTLLGAAGAGAWAARRGIAYEAQATLEYDTRLAGVTSSQLSEGSDLSFRASQELIRTQTYLLKSRTLTERVVHKLALGKHVVDKTSLTASERQAALERAVAQVQGALDVTPVPGTRLVKVRGRAATPTDAAILVNTLIDTYLEKAMDDEASATSRALKWLRAEQEGLKREVDTSELAVFRFRDSHEGLLGSPEERRSLIRQQRQSYNEALTELRIKRVQFQARLNVLKEALAANPDPLLVQTGTIAPDQVMSSMREKYRHRETELHALSISHSPQSPEVVAAQLDLQAIRGQILDQLAAILKGAQADLKQVEREEIGIQQALAEVHEQSVELSRDELEFAGLERARTSRIERYDMVLERTAKADLERALSENTARIVDRASPSATRVGLHWSAATAVGALIALTLSMLVAIALPTPPAGPLENRKI